MAAATSLGSSGLAFEELESAVTVGSYVSGGGNNTGEMLRPAPTVGGFGLSTLVVSSRSGLARGGQTTAYGAEVALGMDSGEPFLLAATFRADRAAAPVSFGGVSIRVDGELVSAYANGARMAAIKVLPGQEAQVFVAYADFGNGSRPGALVVRTSSTMSVQRAEPVRITLPRGTLPVPIESGTDAWVFYGDSARITLDVMDIQDNTVREAATLAARECGMGSRPSSLDRSVFGLFDASLDAAGPIVGTGLYSAAALSYGYGSGQSGYGSGSGSGAGFGSGYYRASGANGYSSANANGYSSANGANGPNGYSSANGANGPNGYSSANDASASYSLTGPSGIVGAYGANDPAGPADFTGRWINSPTAPLPMGPMDPGSMGPMGPNQGGYGYGTGNRPNDWPRVWSARESSF
jgi:hypothetical protein